MIHRGTPSAACILACQLVRLYQAIAPAAVRKACRFEPSCSNYALEVFRRDGLRRGLPKVISRLRRCCPPNGGIDLP